MDDPLPDYYVILQVHPSAEPEIIEAAYRRLMRKYHPDVLSPELRAAPELLSRVRAINIAYDVLSDPNQREAYDAAVNRSLQDTNHEVDPDIETRIQLVCCARTKQRFQMLLGRRKESGKIFQVLGFELVDPLAPALPSPLQEVGLPMPGKHANMLDRLLAKLTKSKQENLNTGVPSPRFPSSTDIKHFFNENLSLNFADIDFLGWKCPACDGEFTYPEGIISSWCRCSACARIYCAGDVHSTKLGIFTRCPWCGRRARITEHIRPGDEVDMPVKGGIERSSTESRKDQKLISQGGRSLPDK